MTPRNKSFLNTLIKSIDLAQIQRFQIQEAIKVGVQDEETCLKYMDSLKQYIQDAQRMVTDFRIAYGKGVKSIANDALHNYVFGSGAS
jgi:hypothetical protein